MLLAVHSPTQRRGSWDGGVEKTPDSKEQKQLSVVKTLVRKVGGSAALYFITLDEGQRCSICLVF